MENLNAEQIIKALECCANGGGCIRDGCPLYKDDEFGDIEKCTSELSKNALALIKELTGENERFRYEREKLIEERDTFRECAYNLQNYVNGIAEKQSQGYEPSAAKAAAEMEMWRVVALEKKKLTEENAYLKHIELEAMRGKVDSYKELCSKYLEENERLKAENARYEAENHAQFDKWLKLEEATKRHHSELFEEAKIAVKEDTVRKMLERLTLEFDRFHKSNFMTPEVRQWIIDQIAKEMLEGEK